MGSTLRLGLVVAATFVLMGQAAPDATTTQPQPAAQPAAQAEAQKRFHALSLVDTPKMQPDFKHFDWVNPDAPKGGTMRLEAVGSFDSLNPYTVKGQPAAGIGTIYDTLLFSSPDEPSTEYGLIAEWVSHADNFSTATFGLREGSKFHDGQPITPDDVIYSMMKLKEVDPRFSFYYKNVTKAEKTGEREVTFTFDSIGNRELPVIVGQLPVLPKHYWEGKGANGETRDLSKTTLEPPLGSGAYKIKTIEAGRRVVYERVKDYWAKDLPVARGLFNFDEIAFTYFRDRLPSFEAFKSGVVDYWDETQASAWATQYNFDAVNKGWIKKDALPHKRVSPMQSFSFNLRRPQFQDIRVRRAFALAFDFESLNKSIFYGQYVRAQSFFGNSELAATGLPQGRELEILNGVKADIPPEVFTTEWKTPSNENPGDFRAHMLEATKLLGEAGWKLSEEAVEDPDCGTFCKLMIAVGLKSRPTASQLRNAKSETLNAEILLQQPEFERIVLPYIENLKRLGINASIRVVDSSQYKGREDARDWDMIVDGFGQSHSPGNEQREYWGSAAAKQDGSRNTIGIASPAIDKLIDTVVFAKDRAELVAATRALDRTLLWSNFLVPQWYFPFDRVAYWDIYGRPEKLPSQSPAYTSAWWLDPAKQKALAEARGK